MNKHVNRNKPAPAIVMNRELAPAKDAMPREVAVELLCSHKGTTGLIRRNALEALCRRWQSTLVPKTFEQRQLEKMHKATFSQLIKWRARTAKRRMEVQRAFVASKKELDNIKNSRPLNGSEDEVRSAKAKMVARGFLLERAIAMLELRAAQLDVIGDTLTSEYLLRRATALAPKKK